MPAQAAGLGAILAPSDAPASATIGLRPFRREIAMAFGTLFRMRVKPGKKDELRQLLTDRSGTIPGMLSAHFFDTGGNEAWGVAVFESEAAYRANADSPEQHQRYLAYRALLDADPEWHDGTVASFIA
jgi:heme-degrading monooxygenase HmoA